MLNIREYNLRFTSPLKTRRITRRIIIHHTVSGDVSAETVHSWHLARGWSGIGYHYLVRQDGTIERGRPENTIGAHAGSEANKDSIGIAVAGNFEIAKPDERQIEALVALIKNIIKRYGNLEILGHRDIMPTVCPGKLFPLEEVQKKVKEEDILKSEAWKLDIIKEARDKGLITIDHDPDEPASKWFVLAVALNLMKELEGRK